MPKRTKRAPTPPAPPAPAPALPTQAELLAKQTADSKAAFLEAYRSTCNVTLAANLTGIARRTHYDWLEHDAAYALEFRDAVDEAADALEHEARRRALEGNRRYKFNKDGTPICHPDQYGENPENGKLGIVGQFKAYVEHEYSDTLLIFLLKGARPEKYADHHKHSGTGKNGAVLLEAIVAGPAE